MGRFKHICSCGAVLLDWPRPMEEDNIVEIKLGCEECQIAAGIPDDREGWQQVGKHHKWTCPACAWEEMPNRHKPTPGLPPWEVATTSDGREGRRCGKCKHVFGPEESIFIETASKLKEDQWEERRKRSSGLIGIGRRLYDWAIKKGQTPAEAEHLYQSYRWIVQMETGIHFDDFGRHDRPENEDMLLASLLIDEIRNT